MIVVVFVHDIIMTGNRHNAHRSNAEEAAYKQSDYKAYHRVLIPFSLLYSLANNLIPRLSHSRTGNQSEQVFSFYDINIVCFGCGDLFL